MSNAVELLKEVVQLLYSVGVEPGKGRDGQLLERIMAELSGEAAPRPSITLPRGRCPCCGAPNLMECDCNPDDQLAAFEKAQ